MDLKLCISCAKSYGHPHEKCAEKRLIRSAWHMPPLQPSAVLSGLGSIKRYSSKLGKDYLALLLNLMNRALESLLYII